MERGGAVKTRGRRDALKKIHGGREGGGKERRRYKAMTIMAVESAADVRHEGEERRGEVEGENLIILRAFSLATFKQLQRIFPAWPCLCLSLFWHPVLWGETRG